MISPQVPFFTLTDELAELSTEIRHSTIETAPFTEQERKKHPIPLRYQLLQ
jgi:hypothetical protein